MRVRHSVMELPEVLHKTKDDKWKQIPKRDSLVFRTMSESNAKNDSTTV